ncbi:phage tail protein [Gilvimarinus agarilyticus]|uniref:phage tail protein n=1 Tax=Gilvimarinus agarilyticus TaxID=679259 RepID=UPI0005A211A9|nr:tail fiber protein [Gilvimarinus agarilyticus]
MSEPFVGEVKLFPWDWPPKGWALCNGAVLSINQNQALFALIGTTYGGNGTTTFALPDFRGRVPVHPSAAHPKQGVAGGQEQVTLTESQMPQHTHLVHASSSDGTQTSFQNAVFAKSPVYAAPSALQPLAPNMVTSSGGSQSHNNIQPSLVLNYCIATAGIFPSRS